MTLSIDDLFTPATASEWEDTILSVAAAVGLNTTSWQSGSVVRAIVQIMARVFATVDVLVSTMVHGGFLDPAATVTPEGGPGWLDIVALYLYNVTRVAATYASGNVTITNASANVYGPFSPGTYYVSNPSTGQVYVNTASLTIAASTTTVGAFAAVVAGSAGTAAPTTISNAITTLVGVTVSNAGTFLGSSTETNASLVARCKAKLGSLSPNGPADAYRYFATTASQIDTTITAPITRVLVLANPATGVVGVWIANAGGAPSGGDVTKVNAVIQANCVPLAITEVTQAATNQNVAATADVWVPAAYAGSMTSTVSSAIATWFAGIPIGGLTTNASNRVPYDAYLGAIFGASPQIKQATGTLDALASDVTLGATSVAVLSPAVVVTVHSI